MNNDHVIAVNNPRWEFSVKYDPFNQCDQLFIKNYRFSKDLIHDLIALVTPYIEPERRSSSILITTKVIFIQIFSY